MNNVKRVMRLDSEERHFRIDESMFREDFVATEPGKLLFASGARIGAFLHDSAHVTASGVFPYADGKGGIRMEWRPKEEIEQPLFLDSLQGIPLTLLHPKNTKSAPGSIIGMVKSKGIVEDTDVRSEIVVYETDEVTKTKARGLSLGFTCDLIEEPGLTPEGTKYDAIQRNLRADHLAVVPNPRVKNARINLDHDDTGKPKMPSVRLDSGIEYEAAAEVIHELTTIKSNLQKESARADSATAAADTANKKVTQLEADLVKVKADAATEAFAAAKARVQLEEVCTGMKITVKADSTDVDLRSLVIKAVRGDSFNLDGKSPDYIEAAYELAVADSAKTTTTARNVTLHGDSRDTNQRAAPPEKRNDAADDKTSAAAKQKGMFEGL